MPEEAREWRLGTERWLQAGAHLFNLGQGIKDVSLPLLLLFELGQPAEIGVAIAAQQLPSLLFSPVAGVLVDRVNRRTALWISLTVRPGLILLLASVVFLGFSLPAACLILLLLGISDALYDISLISYMVAAVRSERLPVLNGRFTSSEILFTRVAGVVAGSLLYSWLGPWIFGLVALIWATSCLTFYRVPSVTDSTARHRRARLPDGFKVVWGDPVLRGLMIGSLALNLSVSAWWVLIPLLSIRRLGVPVPVYGLLLAGAGLCGVVATWVAHRIERIMAPTALLVACVLIVALGGFAMGRAGKPSLFVASMCVLTVADSIWTVWSATMRQRRIPQPQLGVASGAYRAVGRGASPLGTLLGGFAAQDLGYTPSFVGLPALLAAVSVGVGIYWWRGGQLPVLHWRRRP